jgi:hypothetical protein
LQADVTILLRITQETTCTKKMYRIKHSTASIQQNIPPIPAGFHPRLIENDPAKANGPALKNSGKGLALKEELNVY